jgi:branched-chain amino acid aminotransferase
MIFIIRNNRGNEEGISLKKEMILYINGQYFPESKASISVLDHGFLYGDGVYETLILYHRRLFKLNEHIDRLYKSLKLVKIGSVISKKKMRSIICNTLKTNAVQDAYVRVIITRGVGYPLLDPRYCEKPSIIVIPSEMPSSIIPGHDHTKGLNVVTVKIRKVPPICFEPRVKSLNYLTNILARIEAVEANADEAILLDIHGFIAEGTGDNIFIVKSDALYTPSSLNILEGITRSTIIEIAEENSFEVMEKNLTPYDLITADEVFLTSTTGGVIPVSAVDGNTIDDGTIGKVTETLRKFYEKILEEQGVLI